MKNILQIVQDVTRELGLTVPNAVTTSSDPQVVQLLALANLEGKLLSELSGPNEGWPVLRKEQTITLVPSTDNYAFPTDIHYYINRTFWDRSAKWMLAGPQTPQEWQFIKSGYPATGFNYRFRIMDDRIYIDPVPTAAHTLAVEYYSKNWVYAADTTEKEYFTLDTDVPLLSDHIIKMGTKWRFLEAKGFEYQQAKRDWEDSVENAIGRAGQARDLSLSRPIGGFPHYLDRWNIPDTGIG